MAPSRVTEEKNKDSRHGGSCSDFYNVILEIIYDRLQLYSVYWPHKPTLVQSMNHWRMDGSYTQLRCTASLGANTLMS